jgi:hypothetical protein
MMKKVLVGVLGVALLMALGVACSSDDEGAGDGSAASPAVADEYKLAQNVDFTIEVTSPKITRIRRIGLDYSCETERSGVGFDFGKNLSPPLDLSGVPEGAASLALIVTGTDNQIVASETQAGAKANEFLPPYVEPLRVHWLLWNIPADLMALEPGLATTTEIAAVGPSARQGLNYEGFAGWSGPCPSPVGLAREYKSTSGGYNYTYGAPVRGIDNFFFTFYALDTELDLGPEATKDDLLKAIDGHIIAAGELKGQYAQRRKF